MPDVHRELITEASAWTPGDLENDPSWELTLTEAQVKDLLAGLERVNAGGLSLAQIDAGNFHMGECVPVADAIRTQLRDGRGMALLHNFPVAGQRREDIERMYWGFCAHIGRGVTQNSDATLIHYVTEGKLRPNQGTRGVGNPGEVSLHVDLADVVTLLCVRQAKDSPPSRLSSSTTLHNELLTRVPQALERLYEGFIWDRQNEHDRLETPTSAYKVPFFSERDGRVSCRYNRNWMTKAVDRNGRGFCGPDRELLDMIDELTHANRFEFDFQAGDVQFSNNYTCLHGRAPHAPAQGEDDARVLMRIWFDIENMRSFHDEAIVRYGIIRHGKLGWSAQEATDGLEGKLHARRQPDQAPLIVS